MTGGTARRAAVIVLQIGLRSEVRLEVRPRRAAGTAAREGRQVAGLNGGVAARIVGIEAAIAARGRTGAVDRERSSQGEIASRGSTGTSGRRSRPRIG